MTRKSWTDEQFIDAHANCDSVADLLRRLGLSIYGQSYTTVRRACERLGLDYPSNQGVNMTRQDGKARKYIPASEYLVKGKLVPTQSLKSKLYREGYKEERCESCGIVDWNGKELRFQLDHIDGDKYNNLLENLRILCPNCHSQTDTWCGLNQKRKSEKPGRVWVTSVYEPGDYFCECGNKKYPKSKRCKTCYNTNRPKTLRPATEKIDWPDDNTLLKMLEESNFYRLGKQLGVTDNAIRKRMQRRGLI